MEDDNSGAQKDDERGSSQKRKKGERTGGGTARMWLGWVDTMHKPRFLSPSPQKTRLGGTQL